MALKPNSAAQKAAKMASLQMTSVDQFKQKRLIRIQEMEEAYYGKVRPVLKGRSNIPVPILAKYVDEIRSRLDETPIVKFGHKRESQIILARKVKGAWEIDSDAVHGDFARKDRMQRTLAIFSGIGVYDFYSESYPDYKACLDVVDIHDFYFEPTGGSDLENHAFVGKANIFRSKSYIENMAKEGIYDKDQVRKLQLLMASDDYKKMQTTYLNRYDRYRALGLDMQTNQYIGESFVSVAQWEMEIGGERYFLVFDQVSGEWLRFEKLKDVLGTDLYSMVMWQTHEDPHNVLSKSPCDDLMPLAETYRVKLNQLIDNSTKRIWGQRAFDPNFFPDPAQLEWSRPDQLVMARSYNGRPISQGVYEFQTQDATNDTIGLMQHLDNLLATVAGVSPQDVSNDQQKVGVLFGNLQKVSARLGIYNKSYNEAWQKIALRYIHGLKTNMTEKRLVQILGEKGNEWDELSKNELVSNADFDIAVTGSNVELEMNEAMKKKQETSLNELRQDPDLKKELNTKWMAEQYLRISGFKEDDIRRGMDTKTYGNESMISHAAMAVEKIIKGKKPDMFEGADTVFLTWLLDYVRDNKLPIEKETQILSYGKKHMPIVIRNMTLRASMQSTAQGVPAGQAPLAPQETGMNPLGQQPQIPASVPGQPPVSSIGQALGVPQNPPLGLK